MRVLFLDHFNRHGGAQEYILDLARALQQKGVQVYVSRASIPSLNRLYDNLEPSGFEILGKNWKNPLFYLTIFPGLWRLKRFLDRNHVDVVHCNSIPALFLAWLARPKGKIVFTCHDCIESIHKLKIIASCPDLIISVSQAVRDHLLSKQVRKPNVIIYNGFPDYAAGAVPAPRGGGRAFGLVARLAPWKGCELFIDAAKRLSARRAGMQFYLIGGFEDGAYQRRVLHSIEGSSVSHVPFVQGKTAIYNMLDVIVNASIEIEPFGRTLVEGGIFQKPAIGPNRGGPSEIIIPEKSGLTFLSGNAASLADAMERVANAPDFSLELGRGARRRFLETFSIDRIAGEVLEKAYLN